MITPDQVPFDTELVNGYQKLSAFILGFMAERKRDRESGKTTSSTLEHSQSQIEISSVSPSAQSKHRHQRSTKSVTAVMPLLH